jgi:hypothetical protein
VDKVRPNATTRPGAASSASGLIGDCIETPHAGDPSGATAFYRLRSSRIPFHFFTTALAERDNAIAGWQNLTAGLPLIGITALTLAQKANGPNVFVGTPSGVYICPNPAIPLWQRFGIGLPYVRVSDLDYRATIDLLAVGTYGRGVFTVVVGSRQN